MAKKQKSASEIKFLDGKDSKEEVYFEWYCEELKQAGVLERYVYHPEVFSLIKPFFYQYEEQKPKSVKVHKKTLSPSHVYELDFLLYWNTSSAERFLFVKRLTSISNSCFIADFGSIKNRFYCQMNKSYIDVKPGFTKQHSVTEVFSLKRGLLLEKHGINVQKVVIEDLFKHTFTPTRYLLTDSGRQPRKITEWKPISLETFLR